MDYATKGKHFIADVWVKGEIPNLDKLVEKLMKKCKLHIADKLIKNFEPYGQTRLYLLTESHLTFHTYPEHWYFSIDMYTCGDEWEPEKALEVLGQIENLEHLQSDITLRWIKDDK